MRKGQAAIEYLATYGWMLAAVAMVSGIIYSSTGASFCNSQVSGFTGQSLRVEDYGLSANSADMQLSIQNQDSQGFYNQLKEIKIKNRDTGERIVVSPSAQIISPGTSKVFDVNGFESSNECNTFQVQLTYDRKDILPNQKAVGTITANAEIFSESYDPYNPADDTSNFEPTIDSTNSPVEEGNTLQVDYTIENTGTQDGSQQIEFIYNGTVESTESVTLSPAESTSGTFTYTTSSQGDYTAEVTTENTTTSTTVTVTEPSQDFSVSNINAPDTGYIDTEIQASADITSNGPSSSDTAELRVGSDITGTEGTDYEVIASKQVNVDSETKTVTFNSALLENNLVNTGTGQEIGIEYEGRISTKTIDIYRQPEITQFDTGDDVVDNSKCSGPWWNPCRNSDYAEYDINWEATEPAGQAKKANITINGATKFTGISGSNTFTKDGSYGEDFTIKFQVSYQNGYKLCREVTDTADGNDPQSGDFTTC